MWASSTKVPLATMPSECLRTFCNSRLPRHEEIISTCLRCQRYLSPQHPCSRAVYKQRRTTSGAPPSSTFPSAIALHTSQKQAMASTKVIIAGGGIAGPFLAMLLKAKGYNPVIYERSDRSTDAGLSLGSVLTSSSFPLVVPLTGLTVSSRTDSASSSSSPDCSTRSSA